VKCFSGACNLPTYCYLWTFGIHQQVILYIGDGTDWQNALLATYKSTINIKMTRLRVLVLLIHLLGHSSAFIFRVPRLPSQRQLEPLADHDRTIVDVSTTEDPFQKSLLNASGSFGSLVMQMQTQEKEMKAQNKSLQALDLDTNIIVNQENNSHTEGYSVDINIYDSLLEASEKIDNMSYETARSLDEAVISYAGTSVETVREGITVLPLDPLYQAQLRSATASSVKSKQNGLFQSRPGHYQDRIGRDMRHLAAGIAASTETPAQWRLFCQQGGGLFPLLEMIREGAQSIVQDSGYLPKGDTPWLLEDRQEESFLAASNACRALRDLCAVSPELAAVITDGVLRANAAWDGGLLDDLCTMIEYANDFTEMNSSRMKESNPFRMRPRNRKEIRQRCNLYVNQLLLAMTFSSDDAVNAIRTTDGLSEAISASSSFAKKEKRRRWLRYPRELVKYIWKRKVNRTDRLRNPFLEAANIRDNLEGQVQSTANLVLAAIGVNQWLPKTSTQRGLRILCLDGGGSRGYVYRSCTIGCNAESY
jgi:hypothetical protein